MEMIGGRDMPRDSGGGPITPGVKDEMEEIGGGQIGAELIATDGGGPRFKGGKVEPKGGGMDAELAEHIEVEPKVGPMGAAGLGKGGRRG
jgi:hypothetical protein